MLEALAFLLVGICVGAVAYRWIAKNRPEIVKRIDEKMDD